MAAVLTIRKLPEDVQERLRRRAAKAGHSLEAEVREILTAAATTSEASVTWADGLLDRARQRTAGRAQTDSVDLIHEGRDER